MKRVAALSFGLILLLITSFTLPLVLGTTSEWSSEIYVNTYHWIAEKSELRDIDTNERYRYGLGGLNVPGGDNAIRIRSTPSSQFDIFAGDRLDLSWIVEGDMAIPENVNSDIDLAFLPLSINGTSIFELLFSEQELLENLTHAVFVNSTIEADRAIAILKYNDIHDITYEWDTSTGILSRKEVTAPSGLQLIVVPGEGIRSQLAIPDPSILVGVTIGILSIILLVLYRIRR